MADKLDVYEDRYQYRIAWFFQDEDDDMGGILGKGGEHFTEKDLKKAGADSRRPDSDGDDDWEHIKASIAVMNSPGIERDSKGFFWKSKKDALNALKMAKAAIRDKSDKPWPLWAMQAQAARWKPPKGWTP